MVTRRERRRFERLVKRAMRPSRRPSTPATTLVMRLSRKAWSWPVVGVAAPLLYSVGVTAAYRDQDRIATTLCLVAILLPAAKLLTWAAIRKAPGRPRRGAILLLTVAVSAAMSYASLWWIESRQPDAAKAEMPAAAAKPTTAARPATVNESPQDASEGRLSEVRQAHLRQLQPVLRTDAEKLSEIARRVRVEGRVTDARKDRSANAVELRSLFVAHRDLSGDLQNHYQPYAQAKERLRRSVTEQEEEFRRATVLVMTQLSLPPDAEHRRLEVARSVLETCLEKGPGMRDVDTTAVADDERAAFEAFTSFLPDADVAAHCESLKKRAADISANATKLSTEARDLAERTTLSGECKYTKLD
jgi:hypothetical protein